MTDKDIVRFKRGSLAQVGRYFQAREFDCNCGSCIETFVSTALVKALDSLRELLGAKIVVHEGFRCAYRQDWLRKKGYPTSVGRSQHEDGRAADIRCDARSGKDLASHASIAGFMAIGVGSDWIHVDTRRSTVRRWVYSSKGK